MHCTSSNQDGLKQLLVDIAKLNDQLMAVLSCSEQQRIIKILAEMMESGKYGRNKIWDNIEQDIILRRKAEIEKQNELSQKLFKAIREDDLAKVKSLVPRGQNLKALDWPDASLVGCVGKSTPNRQIPGLTPACRREFPCRK
jgi:hypothetical protein